MPDPCKRRPLQDLPLDQFLTNNSTPRIASKRPLSPTSATIFSPAKRRILNDEGLLASSSSSTPRNKPTSVNWLSSSPGRKLEFRMGMDDPDDNDQSHDKPLEPAPALREDKFSSSCPSVSSPLRTITKLAPSPELASCPQPTWTTSPTLSTSLLPAPSFIEPALSFSSSDKRSIHDPGFVIYYDPTPPVVVRANGLDWMDDTESTKENIPETVDHCARKTHKLSMTRNMFMSPGELTKETELSWPNKPAGKAGPSAPHITTSDDTDMQIV